MDAASPCCRSELRDDYGDSYIHTLYGSLRVFDSRGNALSIFFYTLDLDGSKVDRTPILLEVRLCITLQPAEDLNFRGATQHPRF